MEAETATCWLGCGSHLGAPDAEREKIDERWFRDTFPRRIQLNPAADPQHKSKVGKRLQSPLQGRDGVGRDGEKTKSDAPVWGKMHAGAQRVPTNKHRRSLKVPLPQRASAMLRCGEGANPTRRTPSQGRGHLQKPLFKQQWLPAIGLLYICQVHHQPVPMRSPYLMAEARRGEMIFLRSHNLSMTRPGFESSIPCFLRGKERANGVFVEKTEVRQLGARNLGGARRKDGVCCHLVDHRVAAVEAWSLAAQAAGGSSACD